VAGAGRNETFWEVLLFAIVFRNRGCSLSVGYEGGLRQRWALFLVEPKVRFHELRHIQGKKKTSCLKGPFKLSVVLTGVEPFSDVT